MRFVFHNDRFVVADKPAGWLTVPGRAGQNDPRPVLGLALEEHLHARVWPAHRLDAEVSGLVLFALDAAAHQLACRWFEERSVKKTYEALTDGPPQASAGFEVEWRSLLLRGKRRAYEDPRGKEAVTRAQLTGPCGAHWHWRLWPLTGRPHQLRVHLAAQGCPIVGDTLYGARSTFDVGIALRAVALNFAGCGDTLGLPENLATTGMTCPT